MWLTTQIVKRLSWKYLTKNAATSFWANICFSATKLITPKKLICLLKFCSYSNDVDFVNGPSSPIYLRMPPLMNLPALVFSVFFSDISSFLNVFLVYLFIQEFLFVRPKNEIINMYIFFFTRYLSRRNMYLYLNRFGQFDVQMHNTWVSLFK